MDIELGRGGLSVESRPCLLFESGWIVDFLKADEAEITSSIYVLEPAPGYLDFSYESLLCHRLLPLVLIQ